MLRKFAPGEVVHKLPLEDWNAFVDTAQAHRGDVFRQGVDESFLSQSATIVRVCNRSGATVNPGGILAIGNPLGFISTTTLIGETPASSHSGKFVVLLQEAVADEVVDAVLMGACWTRVDFPTSTVHPCAESINGVTGWLTGTPSGPAKILWRESGTGTKWALVNMLPVSQRYFTFGSTCTLIAGAEDQVFNTGSGLSGSSNFTYDAATHEIVVAQPVTGWISFTFRATITPPSSGSYIAPQNTYRRVRWIKTVGGFDTVYAEAYAPYNPNWTPTSGGGSTVNRDPMTTSASNVRRVQLLAGDRLKFRYQRIDFTPGNAVDTATLQAEFWEQV